MSININSKSSLVIAGSAAAAGAVIYGVTKLVGALKNRKSVKEEAADPEEKTEEAKDSEE